MCHITPIVVVTVLMTSIAYGDSNGSLSDVKSDPDAVKCGFKTSGYFPYAGRNFPVDSFWKPRRIRDFIGMIPTIRLGCIPRFLLRIM